MKYAESTSAVSPHQDHRILSFRNAGQRLLHVGCTWRLLAIHTLDDVAGLKSSFFGRAARLNALNDSTFQTRRRLQLRTHVRVEVGDADSPAWFATVGAGVELFLLVLGAELFERDCHIDALTISQDIERDLSSRVLRADFGMKLSGARNLLAVESNDDVADFEASLRSRRVRLHFADDRSIRVLQVEELGVLRRYVGNAYPNVGVADLTVTHQGVDRGLHDLRWNGESHAREASRGRDEEGVNADDLATSVDQRAPRVALIYGRVGLNVLAGLAWIVVIWVGPVQRAHDSTGHGEAEGEWVAEGEHRLPWAKLRIIAQRNVGEVAALDLNHCEIGEWIRADQLGRKNAAVAQRDFDVRGISNHVVVGDDVPVG